MFNLNTELLNKYIISSVVSILIVILLSLTFFVLIHLITKSSLFNRFIKEKRIFKKQGFFFFCGIIFSLSTLIFYYDLNLNFSLMLIATFVLGYFFNYSFYLGTSILNITINSLFFKLTYLNQLFVSNYYLILNFLIIFLGVVLLISIKFIKWRNNLIFLFINSCILITCIIICFPLVFCKVWKLNENIDIFCFCFNFIFYLLLSYILYAIFHFINKRNIKSDYLLEEEKYNHGFLKPEYYLDEIYNFIKQEQIDHGIVVKFFIFGLENLQSQYGNSYYKKIKQQILNNIILEFNKHDIIFYSPKENEYFAFLKLTNEQTINLKTIVDNNQKSKRANDDCLKIIEDDLKKVILKSKNDNIFCSLTAICSLYGVCNNDIKIIQAAIQEIKINIWPFMNSIFYEQLTINEQNINSLNKNKILMEFNLFKPNAILINLIADDHHSQDLIFYKIKAYSLIPYYTNKYEIWNSSNNLVVQSALICHTSAKAIIEFVEKNLNKSSNRRLLIDYPQYLLEQNNFDIIELINNINFYGLNINQFCLNIYCYHKLKNEIFLKNLQQLTKANIQYCFNNKYKEAKNYAKKA